jgi:hypothetical protein
LSTKTSCKSRKEAGGIKPEGKKRKEEKSRKKEGLQGKNTRPPEKTRGCRTEKESCGGKQEGVEGDPLI